MTQDRDRVRLQNLIFPDREICSETALFAHVNERAFAGLASAPLRMLSGGTAGFDTYFNLLNLGTLARNASLDGLRLTLHGTGRVVVDVWLGAADGFDSPVLHREMHELGPDGTRIDLDHALPALEARGRLGLVAFGLTALEDDVTVTGGHFSTGPAARRRAPRIAVSITTFRREAEVAATIRRLDAFLGDADRSGDLGERAHVFVVDNGGTLDVDPGPRASILANPNLGGAGGFARGLAEARAGGFSHAIFMDDDATFRMESLVRTDAFLSIASSDKAAVAGAMIASARPFLMWENGATFRGVCRPRAHGTDLRRPHKVRRMEIDAARPRPRGFYGGWWYFAFPVAHAARDPFPFFVRGDDSSFSLANDFDSVTLPGVVSFQEDFFAKETPLVNYLDARYHLHHHLVHPQLEAGWRGTARIMARFLGRSLARFHYESAEAQLMAWEDVMAGPAFFEANADMAKRRARIGRMTTIERFRPVEDRDALPPRLREPDPDDPPEAGAIRPRSRLDPAVWTLNGHLMPGFRWAASAASVPIALRAALKAAWGHHELTYLSADEGSAYTVRLDRRRFFAILRRALALTLRWRRDYARVRDAHREGYPRLASAAFWAARRGDGGGDRRDAA